MSGTWERTKTPGLYKHSGPRGNRYKAMWWAPDGVNGKPKQHAKTFERRGEAEDFLSKIRVGKREGTYLDPNAGKMVLSRFAETYWLPTIASRAPKTSADYRSLWETKVKPALGDRPLRSIAWSDVESFKAELESDGLSPTRIRRALLVLSTILRMAVRDKRIPENPAQGVKAPTQGKRDLRIPTSEEVSAILAHIPDGKYRTLVHLIATSGLRWGEAVGLTRQNVHLAQDGSYESWVDVKETCSEVGGVLHEHRPTKTFETRMIPLRPEVHDQLARLLEEIPDTPDAYLFANGNEKPVRHSNFHVRYWKPALGAAKVQGLRIHDLRHFVATTLLYAGVNVVTVSRILGHKNPTVTLNVYAHLLHTEDLKRAIMTPALELKAGALQAPKTLELVAKGRLDA